MRIGFSFLRGGGGPTIFMSRLRSEMAALGKVQTTLFLDPTAQVLLFANKVRNPWRRPYVLRVDGIVFDSALREEVVQQRNAEVALGLARASGVVFQSTFNERLVRTHLQVPNVPTTVIPNGVDLAQFHPAGRNMRAALGIRSTTLVAVTSANWRAHKRLDATIECFNRYRSEVNADSVLLVLGKPPDFATGVPEGVRLIGHVAPEDLPSWYRTADICLFFSWLDCCPNTVVEALACAVPVLCTNQGGTRELVERTRGGLVAEADAPFSFQRVRLYEPPQPSQVVLARRLVELVAKRSEIRHSMLREEVGISQVARRYESFLQTILDRS